MRGLLGRRRQPPPLPLFPAAKRSSAPASLLFARLHRLLPASRLLRLLLLLALFSLVPPAFFHLRLRRFHRVRPPVPSVLELETTLPRSGIPTDSIYCVPSVSRLLHPFWFAGLQMRERKCGWITSPPMVCAHGGDSTNAFPNSVGFPGETDARSL